MEDTPVEISEKGRSHASVPPPPAGRARIGLFVGLGVILAFSALLGVRVKQAVAKRAAVAQQQASAQDVPAKREQLRIATPQPVTWMPRVDFLGTLKPWREADVGFETGGRLLRVGVSVGDVVKEGQLLAVLDASRAVAQVGEAESRVKAAEANVALARDQLKRTEALVAQGAIPEAQAEQARQQMALAQAQLDGAIASSKLAKTGAALQSVSAPFSGIVTKAPTGIGSVVSPGVPLIHIEDTSRFRLSATIGEDEVGVAHVGSPVLILYRERVSQGKVIAVVPSLDPATRRAPVEIEVPNDGHLLAWGFVRARVLGGAEIDAFRLPALARKPGSQDEVVKVVDGRAKVVKVSFSVDEDGSLVVSRGLTAADQIVLSPNAETRDGDKIDLGAK
jgi:RND family efflux transporter MFP subunit